MAKLKDSETPERLIVKHIREHLKKRGWLTWKNFGGGYSVAGLPDVMAVRNGEFIAIEVKRPGGEPTARQALWIKQLSKQGVKAFFATSVAEVRAYLEPDKEKS